MHLTVPVSTTIFDARDIHVHIRTVRPCQIGILLSVNSSLINLGTYSQKHTNRKRKHKCFTTKTMHYLYIYWKKHHHNMKQ